MNVQLVFEAYNAEHGGDDLKGKTTAEISAELQRFAQEEGLTLLENALAAVGFKSTPDPRTGELKHNPPADGFTKPITLPEGGAGVYAKALGLPRIV